MLGREVSRPTTRACSLQSSPSSRNISSSAYSGRLAFPRVQQSSSRVHRRLLSDKRVTLKTASKLTI